MMEYGLIIHQRSPRLGIDMTMPQVDLSVQPPQTDLQITDAAVKIDIRQPKIQIDYKACYDSMDRYLNPVDFTRRQGQLAVSDMASFIAKKTVEGDNLAAVETGFNLADAAKMWEEQPREYDVGLIPSVPPDINFDLANPSITVTPGDFAINFLPGQVSVNRIGSISVFLKDPGYLKIIPTYMGHTIDLWA